MEYDRVKPQKMSDVIMEQIGNMIIEGSLQPGQKLPPERELAEKFNTSRPSLRGALHKLEAKGLITRIQGGGTFVSENIDTSFTDPLLAMFKEKEDFKYDLLEYRHALEEATCFLAAKKATDTDLELIQRRYDEWLALHESRADSDVEAKADLAFHMAIAESSHNLVLPHAMRSSLSIMDHSVSINLKELYVSPGRREAVYQHHKEMLEAILARDPQRAREAVRTHLNFVREEMIEMDEQRIRTQRAQRRKDLQGDSVDDNHKNDSNRQ